MIPLEGEWTGFEAVLAEALAEAEAPPAEATYQQDVVIDFAA